MKLHGKLHGFGRVVVAPDHKTFLVDTFELFAVDIYLLEVTIIHWKDARAICSFEAQLLIAALVVQERLRAVGIALILVTPAIVFNHQLAILFTLSNGPVGVIVGDGRSQE